MSGILVDGIPVAFGARKLYTIAGVEALPPTPDYTVSAALMITPGLAMSCEAEREKGLASGRSIDFTLRAQSLEDEGLLPTLFARPTLEARLQVTVSDPLVTRFVVDSVAGWPTDGVGYIGLECFRFTSVQSAAAPYSFEGVTRGLCGLVHYHSASGRTGNVLVTNRPKAWRRRLVTLFTHLCSPEGRFLGDTWCKVDTYCRQDWVGFIDAEPSESPGGKVLRCLPLERTATYEVGGKITGPVAVDDTTGWPILYTADTDQIRVIGNASTTIGSGPHAGGRFRTLPAWLGNAMADAKSDIGVSIALVGTITGPPRAPTITITAQFPGGTASTAIVSPEAWFLPQGQIATSPTPTNIVGRVVVTVVYDANVAWLVFVCNANTSGVSPVDVPSSGWARISCADGTEIVRFDAIAINPTVSTQVALRIVERQVGGTLRTNPWVDRAATVSIIAGAEGAWSDVFRRLMTSSGTGARGPYDTLGLGFGCGIPESLIDLTTLADEPLASTWVNARSDDLTGIDQMLCGWLALWGRCLVQRRSSSGVVQLAVVSTRVADDANATTVGAADVLLGGHGLPEQIDAPNTIEIETNGFDDQGPTIDIPDVDRIQAELARRWTIKAPGALHSAPQMLVVWSLTLLGIANGQAVVSVELPPHGDLKMGQGVNLTTAHPRVFDAGAGAYAPASIMALVIGWHRDIYTRLPRAILLLAGQAPEAIYLCPTAHVIRVVDTTTLEVEDGEQALFAIGEAVYLFDPGNEGTNAVQRTVAAVSTSPSRITLNTTHPAWVNARACITLDSYTAVTAASQRYMFIRSSKAWR